MANSCLGCGLEVDSSGLLEVVTCTGGGLACSGGCLSVVRSPDACNGIELRANGMYSFHDSTTIPDVIGDTDSGSFDFNGNAVASLIDETCVQLTNTSPCRSMRLRGTFQYQMQIFLDSGDIELASQFSPTGVGGPYFAAQSGGLGSNACGCRPRVRIPITSQNLDASEVVATPGNFIPVCTRLIMNATNVVNGHVDWALFLWITAEYTET